MKGDFSRFTFDPARHFTRVLMQQGRVQLDSDFNEQMDILWHYLRTLAADLIGPHGGPNSDQLGFEITTQSVQGKESVLKDLIIGFGRYYVDGILCENTPQSTFADNAYRAKAEATRMAHDSAADEGMDEMDMPEEIKRKRPGVYELPSTQDAHVTYYGQSGYPFSAEEAKGQPYKLPDAPFFVYLDVWERSISAIEEPGIREVALGGPDTAARSQVVWQVRARAIPGATPTQAQCDGFENSTFWKTLMQELQPEKRGRLAAKAREPRADDSTDPCIISPDARYRGAENQLYRVEIHTGGIVGSLPRPTFKWSRDNGANVYPVLSVKEKTVFLEHLGRDARSGLQAGDWVEIVDDDYTLLGKTQPLSQVESVDAIGMSVTLKTAHPAVSQSKHPQLRRWDQRAGDQNIGGLEINDDEKNKDRDNAALIKAGAWLNLEDGIQVYFEAGSTYVAGDYWLIPARTATGDIEWPGDNPQKPPLIPPQGVQHHYAPLAGIFFDPQGGTGTPPSESFVVVDLRRRIDPAAECFTIK